MKIGIAHLAFRNFIIGFNDAVEKLNVTHYPTVQHVWTSLMSIEGNDYVYGEILRLVTNFDKMDVNDTLRYAITAKLLLVYLEQYTDFFDSLPLKCREILPNITDWKRIAAAILMKHMGQLVN